MDNFTESQYKEIWDMIFSQTGYPPNHPKHETKAPKEEQVPIKVSSFINSYFHPVNGYTLFTTGEIPESKYQSIKEAIEGVLNGKQEGIDNYISLKKVVKDFLDEKFPKLYTESELLQARRDAFDAAREIKYVNESFFNEHYEYLKNSFINCSKHKSYEDYINSLK